MGVKKILFIILLVIIASNVTLAIQIDDMSYSIKVNFNEDIITMENLELVQGRAAENYPEDYTYTLKLISFKEETLGSRSFNLPDYWLDMDISVTNGSFNVYLPYNTNAQKIELYKIGNKISELDISKFASCNQDSFCSADENIELCPDDCSLKETAQLREEEPIIKSEQVKETYLSSLTVLIILLTIILMTIIYLISKSKKKN